MRLGDDHRLERPDRPEGHDGGEIVVLANNSLAFFLLYLDVVAKEAGIMRATVI